MLAARLFSHHTPATQRTLCTPARPRRVRTMFVLEIAVVLVLVVLLALPGGTVLDSRLPTGRCLHTRLIDERRCPQS